MYSADTTPTGAGARGDRNRRATVGQCRCARQSCETRASGPPHAGHACHACDPRPRAFIFRTGACAASLADACRDARAIPSLLFWQSVDYSFDCVHGQHFDLSYLPHRAERESSSGKHILRLCGPESLPLAFPASVFSRSCVLGDAARERGPRGCDRAFHVGHVHFSSEEQRQYSLLRAGKTLP